MFHINIIQYLRHFCVVNPSLKHRWFHLPRQHLQAAAGAEVVQNTEIQAPPCGRLRAPGLGGGEGPKMKQEDYRVMGY